MIQEATTPHYKAVICRTCRQPIPVPGIVIRMESMSPLGLAERVFNLRCRSCEAEKPYRSGQIVEVEGEPKKRRTSLNRAFDEHTRRLSRAATA